MFFDRFDICGAYYLFFSRHFNEKRLSQLEKLGYNPGLSIRQNRFETENQRWIYQNLYRKYRNEQTPRQA